MAVEVARAGPPSGPRTRVSAALWRRPWVKALALLTLPLAGFLVVYVGSLAVLFVSSFWTVDAFTGKLRHVWNLAGGIHRWADDVDPSLPKY